jgi:hypothetical protein
MLKNMIQIDVIAKQFLHAVNTYEVCGAAILLFVFAKEEKYSGLIYLLFLTMLYNSILKHLFKWPLPETCPGHGYGFPSGHTNFMSVFHIWLILANNGVVLRAILIVLWITSITSIALAGYHYFMDVILTIPFSMLSIMLYKYAYKKFKTTRITSIIVWSATVFLLILYNIEGSVHAHVAIAYGSIIGFCLSSSIFNFSSNWKLNLKIDMNAILGFVIFMVLLVSRCNLSAKYILSNLKSTILFAIVAAIRPFMVFCLEKYRSSKTSGHR